ncbi:MAG: 50S ribosomal protein L35 [Christensenellales bacterium]|jgi:large subunit ribosomal protein L35
MAQYKIKSSSSASKRFRVTGTGKIKRAKAYKNHKLNGKNRKTKRNLRAGGYVSEQETRTIHKMIPYK